MKIKIVIGWILFGIMSCESPKEHKAVVMAAEALSEEGVWEQAVVGKYAHSVYVWLKHPESGEDRAVFEASMKKFGANIPYATSIHFGTPLPSERDVVDGSYTYSFLITFPKESDLATYDKDPVHLTFRAETAKLWSRVVIYDSVNIME
jgi:hypothetical protein